MKTPIGLFAIIGAIKWTVLVGGLVVLSETGHGLGDGAPSVGANLQFSDILMVAGLKCCPVVAILSAMLLSFNVIRKNALKMCCGYVLTVLLIVGMLIIIFAKEILPYHFCFVVSGTMFSFFGLFAFFCCPVKRANPS